MRRNRPELLALALALVVVLPLTHTALAVGPQSASVGADDRPAAPVTPAAPAASADASATVVRNETNTTNYLSITDAAVERERFANASLDLGGALAADAYRLQERQQSLSFDRAFARASGRDARVALVRNETKQIERQIDRLKQRQRRALAAFNAGDVDAHRLVRRLTAIDVEARQLQTRLRRVRDTGSQTGFRIPNALVTRINNVRSELVPLRGSVRANVGRVMAGERPGTSVYVLTAPDSVVLAAVGDRTAVREAYLADRRQPGSPDQFEDGSLPRISVANQRAAELYPWTYSIPAPPSIRAFGNSSVYNVSDTHPHGKLIAYLDGATEDVYREVQVKRLDALPTRNLTATNGSIQLGVERTHATGPMRLTVTDTFSGGPVDATVWVNGQPVGTTGDDGALWTVTPHDAVRVEARTAEGDVVHLRFFAL